MLIMPNPNPAMPSVAWETAENREMEQVVKLYGKVFHLWQTDRGDRLPLGKPKLMTSFTEDGQMEDWDEAVGDRDRRFGEDWKRKKELRKDIEEMEVHPGELSLEASGDEILLTRCQMPIKRGRSKVGFVEDAQGILNAWLIRGSSVDSARSRNLSVEELLGTPMLADPQRKSAVTLL